MLWAVAAIVTLLFFVVAPLARLCLCMVVQRQ
jgi:hypothetical protein